MRRKNLEVPARFASQSLVNVQLDQAEPDRATQPERAHDTAAADDRCSQRTVPSVGTGPRRDRTAAIHHRDVAAPVAEVGLEQHVEEPRQARELRRLVRKDPVPRGIVRKRVTSRNREIGDLGRVCRPNRRLVVHGATSSRRCSAGGRPRRSRCARSPSVCPRPSWSCTCRRTRSR